MLELPPLPDIFGNYAIIGLVEVLPPSSVSWWPTTIGWKILGLATLTFLLWKAYGYYRFWVRNRYRQLALKQLDALIDQHGMSASLLSHSSRLLKATALHRYPRAEVAGLSGERWLQWLQENGGGATFCESSQSLLSQGIYQATLPAATNALQQSVLELKEWIRQHPEPSNA